MNVAIVGSGGYIAGFLWRKFISEPAIEKIIKVDKNDEADIFLNLKNPRKFNYEIFRDIDYVVFTAAVSSPDKCADEFDVCWDINVKGTIYFIKKAIGFGCKVLFFSSDAVFGNIPGMIYNEKSETNAYTPYGKMKKAVEDEFKENDLFKAIRLSYVISAEDRFTSYCLNCIKNGDIAEIFHPFYRNCIGVKDVVDVVMWFALHFEEYSFPVLNVAGKELVSRVRIADEINRLLSEKLSYTIVSPDEKFFVNRPQVTQMRSIYMQEYGILADTSFTEKIQNELKEIINEY